MSSEKFGRVETELTRLLNRQLRSALSPVDLRPIQVTGIYLVFGFLALYFSDVYLPQAVSETVYVRQIQALKAGVEVLVTAGLIFGLTYRSRRSLQHQNRRLEALQTERSIIHRVFRHNLRQDINLVIGYCDFVQSSSDDQQILNHCEKLIDRMTRVERYQRQMEQIEDVLSPKTPLQRTDLSAVINDDPLVADLMDSDDVALTLDVPDAAPVFASQHFSLGFQELLENAVEHNDSAPPAVEVSVNETGQGMVELSVMDNGPGIPEYEQRAISQLEEQQLTHSSGLGLWLAKLTCIRSGGDLKISTRSTKGSRVTMTLPRASAHVFQRKLLDLFQ